MNKRSTTFGFVIAIIVLGTLSIVRAAPSNDGLVISGARPSSAAEMSARRGPRQNSNAAFAFPIAAPADGRAPLNGFNDGLVRADDRWRNREQSEDPSFRRHVVPLLSRVGCSSRECHGAFSGQGGFQLSLFGYDFEQDHKEISEDADGGEAEVRVQRDEPEKSLLLLKPTLQTKHKGKQRVQKDSWEYNLLLQWIASGAENDAVKTGEFDRLEVFPKEIIFKQTGELVQLRVVAHWKDGTVEDVTQLTRFRSNDDAVASVSDAGRIESKDRGDTHVIAFYDNGVLPIPVMLPVTPEYGDKYPDVATRTVIDQMIVAKLRKVGIVPSEVGSDTEFLRRVSLDLTGTLPTPDEIRKFLADTSPGKRTAQIERLLETPAYAAWWTTKLCDFTGNNPRALNNNMGIIRNTGNDMARQWYQWIYKRVLENLPYDQIAAGIILATSRTAPEQSFEGFATEMAGYFRRDNPADFAERPTLPYYWQRRNVQKPEEKALAFSHSFLGLRIECAQCHKHPFDQWTKTDFEQFQAFFSTVSFRARPSPRDDGVTYQSLTEEIRKKISEQLAGKPAERQVEQRALQNETARRREAGELVPWPEVFVDARRPGRPVRKERQQVNGSGRVITPKLLGGEEVMLQQYTDPREPLLEWLRDKDNPYLARAFVNRVWANYFNRGIIDPPDDMNLANPPVNGELLNYLTVGFVEHGYDMKWLHREILNSDTYQRSWKTNPSNKLDEKNFSHAVLRRLPAEVIVDAISMATASPDRNAAFAETMADRAIGPAGNALVGPGANGARRPIATYALNIFGKPPRDVNCDCERTAEPTLLQTLYTRNDPEVLARIETERKGQWIAELRRSDGKNSSLNVDELIKEVFLRTVSRLPSDEERRQAQEDIAAAKHPIDGVRDLLWAMLNTREFVVNH